MNIVFGGTFNPPTKAHEKIISKLKEKFNPQNIIIIPTGDSYTWKDICNFNHRFNMSKLAFKDDIVLDIENNSNYKGTLYTLRLLSKKYDDLYFCMGADNLVNIKKWLNYNELLNEFNFIIFKRNNIDILKFINDNLKEYKDKFKIVDFNIDISSSQFRNNKDFSLISDEVKKYIIENDLY